MVRRRHIRVHFLLLSFISTATLRASVERWHPAAVSATHDNGRLSMTDGRSHRRVRLLWHRKRMVSSF